MKKFMDGLLRMASVSPRRREDSPYADVMERAVAWSMDLFLLYYLLRDLFDRLAMQVFGHNDIETIDAVKRANFATVIQDGSLALQAGHPLQVLSSPALHLYLTEIFAEFLLLGIIVVGAQAIFGNTPGKWVLGLKIARRKTFAPIARWRYVLRYLAYVPSVGFFMLGIVWCHFNKERRSLHDIIAGTVVLQTRPDGWYWNKIKQGYRWLRGKISAPKTANDNTDV